MSIEGFEWVWSQTLEGIALERAEPAPSPDLKPLIEKLYEEACRRPPDTARLDTAIERVLEFLASDEGKTHDNCWVTSNFLMPGDEYWEEDWDDLPERYVETLGIMGLEMWQAVEDPESCKEFGGLPDQLLREFRTGGGGVTGPDQPSPRCLS